MSCKAGGPRCVQVIKVQLVRVIAHMFTHCELTVRRPRSCDTECCSEFLTHFNKKHSDMIHLVFLEGLSCKQLYSFFRSKLFSVLFVILSISYIHEVQIFGVNSFSLRKKKIAQFTVCLSQMCPNPAKAVVLAFHLHKKLASEC